MDKFDKYKYFFELPLYTKIKIENGETRSCYHLIYVDFKIDGYNPSLKENTTYNVTSSPKTGTPELDNTSRVISHILNCVRTNEKFYVYTFYNSQDRSIQKIGQYISIADFHISKIKSYDKVLERSYLKELTRSIGLAANGVGIGSFVYLRRIFEKLLDEAYSEMIEVTGQKHEGFIGLRAGEKIDYVKELLPQFLVENKSIYSILSKGIHNLTEEECLEYFDPIKLGIELILEEKLEKYNKAARNKEAKKKIEEITLKIKK